MFYAKEEIDPNIRYVKDTENNRLLLTQKLGEQFFISADLGESYIEIKLKEKTWRSCFTFEWLYRNQPELIQIEDLSI